jgi:hypothetical protein
MKAISTPEAYIALKHHANKEHRQKKCFYMIKSLNAIKFELGNQLAHFIIEADKFTGLREYYLIESTNCAKKMQSISKRINKLTNYYNSLITI